MPRLRTTPRAALLAALVACLGGCQSPPGDTSPEGTVRAFLDAMSRVPTERAAAREAFRLLDGATRRELGRRAEEATALSGRRLHPWDMLVPGRFRLRFRPRGERAYEATVRGDRATVVVRGAAPGERAEVPLVREPEGWRLVLALGS